MFFALEMALDADRALNLHSNSKLRQGQIAKTQHCNKLEL